MSIHIKQSTSLNPNSKNIIQATARSTMRDTLRTARATDDRKRPKYQKKPTAIAGQYSAAIAAAHSLARSNAAAARNSGHGSQPSKSAKRIPADHLTQSARKQVVTERSPSRLSIVQLPVVRTLEAAKHLSSTIASAGEHLSRSFVRRGAISGATKQTESNGNIIEAQNAKQNATQNAKQHATQNAKQNATVAAKPYHLEPHTHGSRARLAAKWTFMKAKASSGNSPPKSQSRISPEKRPAEKPTARQTHTPPRQKPAPQPVVLDHRQHGRNDSSATAVTRFSDFIRAGSPRPKMPTLNSNGSSWRVHSPRMFHRRKSSVDSDMSFADAGKPDEMLTCTSCGETRPDKIERYGVCKACAHEAADRSGTPVPAGPSLTEWREALNRDTTYTLPGNPWTEGEESAVEDSDADLPELRSPGTRLRQDRASKRSGVHELYDRELRSFSTQSDSLFDVSGWKTHLENASPSSSRASSQMFGMNPDSPGNRFAEGVAPARSRTASPAFLMQRETSNEKNLRDGYIPAASRSAFPDRGLPLESLRPGHTEPNGRAASPGLTVDTQHSSHRIAALYEAAGYLYPRTKSPLTGRASEDRVRPRYDTPVGHQHQLQPEGLRDSFFVTHSDPLGKLAKGQFPATDESNWI